jgi:hypothetical protein
MRNAVASSLAVCAVVGLCAGSITPVARAQQSATAFDSHDLNGIWGRGPAAAANPSLPKPDARGMMPDGGVNTQWGPSSPLTSKGLAQVNANKSGKGPRQVPPAFANDLLGDANPPGLLRALVYGRPFRMIVLPDRVVQLFEWTRVWREINTDGRTLPEDIGPFWYGYSVGKWDGDTLVVDTNNLDARAWLDEWGSPFSESLKLQERWRRTRKNDLSLVLTIDDPVMYTKTWTTNPRAFRFQTKDMPDGELLEVIFAPVDEKSFNERIRNPAGGRK